MVGRAEEQRLHGNGAGHLRRSRTAGRGYCESWRERGRFPPGLAGRGLDVLAAQPVEAQAGGERRRVLPLGQHAQAIEEDAPEGDDASVRRGELLDAAVPQRMEAAKEGRPLLVVRNTGQDCFCKNSLKRLQMGVVYLALWLTV